MTISKKKERGEEEEDEEEEEERYRFVLVCGMQCRCRIRVSGLQARVQGSTPRSRSRGSWRQPPNTKIPTCCGGLGFGVGVHRGLAVVRVDRDFCLLEIFQPMLSKTTLMYVRGCMPQ